MDDGSREERVPISGDRVPSHLWGRDRERGIWTFEVRARPKPGPDIFGMDQKILANSSTFLAS